MNQLLHAVAVMYKRAWRNRETVIGPVLLRQLGQLLSSDPAKRVLALVFMSELVNEFSSARSSELGVSADFHLHCHRSFEQRCTSLR